MSEENKNKKPNSPDPKKDNKGRPKGQQKRRRIDEKSMEATPPPAPKKDQGQGDKPKGGKDSGEGKDQNKKGQ